MEDWDEDLVSSLIDKMEAGDWISLEEEGLRIDRQLEIPFSYN